VAGCLTGKVAVVTGAASGIGRACVERFLAEGARVVAGDIDSDGLEQLAAAADASLSVLPGDVADPATSEALADAAVETYGAIDVFYANAGGSIPTPLTDLAFDELRAILALNLESVWHGAQAALARMIPRRSGCILATSSGAGLGAVEGLAAYGAAKSGVQALVKSLALEHGPLGIRACAIAPGPIATPGLLGYLDSLPGGRDAFAAQLPLRRLGHPEEIAAAAAFLASDQASYISGVTLPVDGAVHAQLFQPKLGR